MKFRITIAAFCLGLMTIAAGAARAQQPNVQAGAPTDAQSRRSGLTIKMDTDLVVIDVTATDKHGAFVRDLRAEEVQVFEDGQERKINFFAMTDEATLSRPLAVVFALDLSGSLRPDEMNTLREAALKFTALAIHNDDFAASGMKINNLFLIATKAGGDLREPTNGLLRDVDLEQVAPRSVGCGQRQVDQHGLAGVHPSR